MNMPVAKQNFSLAPQSIEEAMKFAQMLSQSDLVPKDFIGKPGNVLVAIQWGMELGLQPMQAMQNIAVINGRPALWGDAVIALVRSSPLCEYVYETDDGHTATCRVKRRGEEEQVRTFSMEDAARAGLSGKSGPWTQYPKRMRQMRARAFAMRDVFPDCLRGMPVAEELQDLPERDMGAADVVAPKAERVGDAKAELPPYPDVDFAKNLPAWKKAIAAEKTTADELIAKVSTKGALSDEQIAAIRNIPATEAVQESEE